MSQQAMALYIGLYDKVRIWSAQHCAYWRPEGQGYTCDRAEAGVWSLHDAVRVSGHCGREKLIQYERVEEL